MSESADQVSITVDYTTHTHKEPWKKTDYFCPCCGKQAVWNRNDGGDYYAGEMFVCLKCDSVWHWPSEPFITSDKFDIQRIEKVRAAAEIGKAMEG